MSQLTCKIPAKMASIKLYLDARAVKPGQPAPVKIAITQKGRTSLLPIGIKVLPQQWDKINGKVVLHPRAKSLNNLIGIRFYEVQDVLMLMRADISSMSSLEIKNMLTKKLLNRDSDDRDDPKDLFVPYYESFIGLKTKERTIEIYNHTLSKIKKFYPNYESLRFTDINKNWLTDFDSFLSVTSPAKNARNIHLRNIRTVFNSAIDDEITTFYPFRKFKIRPEATVKRSLTVDQLRTLFSFPVEPHTEQYLDMFKLIFFLIGINIVDLCNLKEIRDGRIEYHRAKTNRLYSIKVEPEAIEIINKYNGENYLLNILDRYANYRDYAQRLNRNLKQIGPVKRVGLGGKKIYSPLFPDLTTYWARHSWATIAAKLDIPKETISAALGHEIGSAITSIYIDFDRSKVDRANRAVIDYVLYNKISK